MRGAIFRRRRRKMQGEGRIHKWKSIISPDRWSENPWRAEKRNLQITALLPEVNPKWVLIRSLGGLGQSWLHSFRICNES